MITDKIRQFFCGLQGHDVLRHFGKTRVSLQCVSCGYETPGWDLERTTGQPRLSNSSRAARPLSGNVVSTNHVLASTNAHAYGES